MNEQIPAQEQITEEMTAVLKALTDPTRLRVFAALMRGASCNGWLREELDLSPNLLSHHLKVLREAGLVQDRRDAVDGRWIYYQVDVAALSNLHQWLVQFFDPAQVTLSPNLCGPEGKPAETVPLSELLVTETAV
jgi:ArsR family transcriptional regulator, arsenate/arsenite/antimonite-responsive transcriptional repressor